MRLMVSTASTVWRVESTRCPVSAAVRAISVVSRSRISPTMMTSGSWRREARRARANDMVSNPISRWLITLRRSLKAYSMGSSMVTMWTALCELM